MNASNTQKIDIASKNASKVQEKYILFMIFEVCFLASSRQCVYLIYNDADGTEHYFPKTSTNTYEDEDGLRLKIVKSGDKYIIMIWDL